MRRIAPRETLAQQAYRQLKEEIVSGRLEPNEELPEERLSAQLGISRTPLREALMRLSMEGLVILKKGSPATVATFTKEESRHLMEIRRVLEVHNLEKISDDLNDSVFDKLDSNLASQAEAVGSDDFHNFIEYDREFHLILSSLNENPKTRELLNQMNTGVNRAFLILSNTLPISAKDAYEEHRKIVESLKAGDIDRAKQLMTEHLMNVEKRFLKYYQ
ncbi:GntR family transcriptional regulator [Bhargavaea cecembensis]|uniref:GntR family transcriptional regulator n=1 Tax=Bhargavaea cecembensis TaxID=394098 RepID=A0A165H5J0_9BACL|nr:GntR family transcriptional regulator [Bhargavaea cecembensis]KZE38835.1 GntR family transcriptional regulator [Bhargavaea cecembensis]